MTKQEADLLLRCLMALIDEGSVPMTYTYSYADGEDDRDNDVFLRAADAVGWDTILSTDLLGFLGQWKQDRS